MDLMVYINLDKDLLIRPTFTHKTNSVKSSDFNFWEQSLAGLPCHLSTQ